MIDEKLRAGPFANTAKIFAAPESVAVGDASTPADIAGELRRSGYTESRGNPIGYLPAPALTAIEIFPGPDSYFDQEAGVIKFCRRHASPQIVSLQDNTARGPIPAGAAAHHQPLRRQPREAAHGEVRAISRKVLVEAVTSAEDKRFFQHSGFDPVRIVKAAYVDLKEGRKDQGASTLSMQLARKLLAGPGQALDAQDGRGDHHPAAGADAHQGTDLRGLRQPGLPGLARLVPASTALARRRKRIWARTSARSICRKPPSWPA